MDEADAPPDDRSAGDERLHPGGAARGGQAVAGAVAVDGHGGPWRDPRMVGTSPWLLERGRSPRR